MRSLVSRRSIRIGVLVLALLLITNVLVVLAVTEYDTPSCRWARQPDGTLSVSWNYGTYIQSYPAWKTAFQQSAADWPNALTKLRLYYTSDAFITCNAYYEQSSAAGRGWVFLLQWLGLRRLC